MAGSVVPHRVEGMAASALAPDYQRIVEVLESDGAGQVCGVSSWPCPWALKQFRRRSRGCGRRRNAWWNGVGFWVRPGVFTALATLAS